MQAQLVLIQPSLAIYPQVSLAFLQLNWRYLHEQQCCSCINLDVFDVSSDVNVNVGKDGVKNGGATLLADTLVLNGANLIVDPEDGYKASKVVIQNITEDDIDVHTLGGKVGVKLCSKFGYTQSEFDDVMATT